MDSMASAHMHRLFITPSFLAHSPTLRYMRAKFEVPRNTKSVCVQMQTVAALKTDMVTGPLKEFRWPTIEEDHLLAMAEFTELWKLPGVIGAIDETLIVMRKTSQKQGGIDTNGWLECQGHIASLFLAVVSAKGRFIYLSAGYPGYFGDAGAFKTSLLEGKLEAGLLSANWSCIVSADTRVFYPFLVGDGASHCPSICRIFCCSAGRTHA